MLASESSKNYVYICFQILCSAAHRCSPPACEKAGISNDRPGGVGVLYSVSILSPFVTLGPADSPRGPVDACASADEDYWPRRGGANHGFPSSRGGCFQDPSFYDRVPQAF